MSTTSTVRWSILRFSALLTVALLLFLGLFWGLPAIADPSPPEPTRSVGSGTGAIEGLIPGAPWLDAAPIPLSIALDQWTTLLSETFESTSWPTAGWTVFDNDGATNGEYYWANRCPGRNSARSAWAIGGGANGQSLSCGATYPNNARSWMAYGPVDLSQATAVELSFHFWLNSECEGTSCATKSDRLWVTASTNGTDFNGWWWAGDWYQDAAADANGWVARTLDVTNVGGVVGNLAGQPQVWFAFIFQSDGSTGYPGGALVDNVVLRATMKSCAQTASIRSFTTDRTCYIPGQTIAAFVDVGTTLSSQSVKVDVDLWSGSVVWATASQTFTAPGSRVLSLQVPADLFPGTYTVSVAVYDANNPTCLQATADRTVTIDPVCGTVTPPVTNTPTRTRTPTATVTRGVSPTPELVATRCPGESVFETKTIFIPAAPGRADVLFAFDTTASMGPVLSSAKTNAVTIMNNLAALIPDIQFGVVDFRDYPIGPYGESGDWPYLLRQGITGNRSAVEAAINATRHGGGDDYPEAYTRVLYESYSDPAIGWRSDARRFLVMFGDDVPHDNNLNERVVNPPVNPGGVWCGNTSAGCVLDPGRDGVPGTADDLDFQPVLDAMRTHRITLLYVVSGGGSTSQANMVSYWKQWASWTNAGGDAIPLSDAANLPAAIQDLVTAASRRIARLELLTDPPSYQSWLTVNPPAYTNLDIPAGGRTVTFDVEIRVPIGTPIGTTHTFAVRAVGDGAVYGGQGVRINVPTSCATATPTRTATRTLTRTPTATRTPTLTPTMTLEPCPSLRPPVTIACVSPNYVRNPFFERFNRSWSQSSSLGREIVSGDAALEGFYSAEFQGPAGQTSDEWLYQVLDIPPDVTAASFWVQNLARQLASMGAPASSAGSFFRASLYDQTMSRELVRLWEFNPLIRMECEIDPSSYNLTAAQLDLIRGQKVALVFRFRKAVTGMQAGVKIDGIHFTVCSPSPPCRVERDKTASPGTVMPGDEVAVILRLTGLDGACLPARKAADVMLVVDRSGSMDGQKMTDAKRAAKAFVDRMDLSTDQVGLVAFSDSAALRQALTSSAGDVRAAIDAMVPSGMTNIAAAITTAQAELTSARHKAGNVPVMVLLSDGQPTAGGDPRIAANAAKTAGTRIFTIGLGADVDPNLMRDLASSPGDYFYAPDSTQLDAIYEQIAGAIGGAPATNITIVDRLSPHVTLVPGSFTGVPAPSVSADGKTLTWRIPRLGLETKIWSYRVKMTTTPGTWPTNDSATATYTDSQGNPGSLVFPIPYVTVLPPAATNPQIMCRDHENDDGSTPSNPNNEAWWSSPDIWVRNAQDGIEAHQNPITGKTNHIYVRVHNIGDATVNDISVHVYDAKAAVNLLWPDDWMPPVGTATIASLAAGRSAVVSVPWTPFYTGHYCFLVRIEAPDDPITFDGWVPFDNNICQRNVQIIEGGPSASGVNAGNRNRGSGYGAVTVSSDNLPDGASGIITFTDPDLFNRWRGAGGTVTGGEIITDTHSVRFDGRSTGTGVGTVDLVMDRIPFEGEEVSPFTINLTVPANGDPGASDIEPPTLSVNQVMDGLTVGGNILQPPVHVPVLLPLIFK